MKNKIAVIGSGAMATAVSKVAYDSGYENIMIYGVNEVELNDLKIGKNTTHFPDSVSLPLFNTTTNIKESVSNAEYVILAVPSQIMDIALENLLPSLSSEVILINVAKGFYPRTNVSLHEGIKNKTKLNKLVKGVVSLIGPSHAEEIVKSAPTIITVVDDDIETIKKVQMIFSNNYFRTYAQTDVIGAEVGAAYKNVLAIASGISAGLGYGINTTAALLTRGLAEMSRFNKFMGGKAKTLMGLTGIGDLIVTAMSPLSRNFSFGKDFVINGHKALDTKATVEGLVALKIIYKIANDANLDLPILNFLYEIINNDINISDHFKRTLWDRDIKSE